MKCGACGYRHNEWDEDICEIVSDDTDEFIHIDGHFTVESGDYYKNRHEVLLYSCPKCLTVRMSRW